VTPTIYRPRTQNAVEAWLVPDDLADNSEELSQCAAWAEGVPLRGVGVHIRIHGRMRIAFPGSWLVRTQRGIEIYKDDEFQAAFVKEGA